MATLSISITIPDDQVSRMRQAFARRFGKPDLTVEEMLAGLKRNAINQINEAVITEERNALEAEKHVLRNLDLS